MPLPKAKSGPATANIYAIVGSDESEVKRVAAGLAAELTPPDASDFGREVIDGAADNAEQAATRIRSTIEALQTLPFLADKIGLAEERKFLGDTPIGRRLAFNRRSRSYQA
jgi:DNA polymerase-3 subunit delta